MSAGYAHITLVNLLAVPNILDNAGIPQEAAIAVLQWFKFCELGSVSPDLPYLKLEDNEAQEWADRMHKQRAGEMIHAGISVLKDKKGEEREKGIAWLLGYTAHVYTDLAIHPVVNLRVGSPYEQYKKEHRICEMHQDVYIYQRLNLGQINLAEHLDSGLSRCGEKSDKELLDQDIVGIWLKMFQKVYHESFSMAKPEISEWYRRFTSVIDKIAEEGGRLVPIARHVAAGEGLVYPREDEVEKSFINRLKTPMGVKEYDEIFDHAKNVVLVAWKMIADAITKKDTLYIAKIGMNMNLDEGKDDKNKMVAWEAVA